MPGTDVNSASTPPLAQAHRGVLVSDGNGTENQHVSDEPTLCVRNR